MRRELLHANALQPDNTHVVVGMSEGTMSVRRRAVPVEETVVMQQTKRRLYGGTVRHRMRGQNRKPTDVRRITVRNQLRNSFLQRAAGGFRGGATSTC